MKTLLSFITLLFCTIVGLAQQAINLQNMEFTTKIQNYFPRTELKCEGNEAVIEYKFPSLNLSEQSDGSYSVNAPNFGVTTAPGSPMMPKTIEFIPIPEGYNSAVVELVSTEHVTLPFSVATNEGTPKDNDAVSPAKILAYKNIGGELNLCISISPYEKNLLGGYDFFKTMKIKVTFECLAEKNAYQKKNARIIRTSDTEDSSQIYYDPEYPDWDINKGVFPGIKDNGPTYFVFSVSKYKPAIKMLENWKKTMGYNFTPIYFDYFTDELDESQIKGFIDFIEEIGKEYESFKEFYFLIVGTHLEVPLHRYVESDGGWNKTPVPYVDTDADYIRRNLEYNHIPNTIPTYYGRIPASNIDEAYKAINKIIAFERNEHDSGLCNSTAMIGRFIDANKDGIEDNNWITQFENIRQVMLKTPRYFTHPLYNCDDDVNPQYWYNDDSSTSLVPVNLKKPSYPWSASLTEINNAASRGCLLMSYLGDGKPHQWNPKYNWNEWVNNNNPYRNQILVSTNAFSGSTVGMGVGTKSLLLSDAVGPVGVIAPNNSPYMDRMAYFIEGVYRAIFPNAFKVGQIGHPGGVSTLPVVHFGEINDLAMTSVHQKFPDDFNTKNKQIQFMNSILGDPGMLMAYIPQAPCDVSVEKVKNGTEWNVCVIVNWPYGIGGEYFRQDSNPVADITVYDKSINDVTHIHGNAGIVVVSDPANTVVSVRYKYSRPVVISNIPDSSTVTEEFVISYLRDGDNINLSYTLPEEADEAYIHIMSVNGTSETIPCDVMTDNTTVSLSGFPDGVYKIVMTTNCGKSNTISILK